MTTTLTATAEEPDPNDAARIDEIIAELRRVWKRNPTKRLMQVIAKAQSSTPIFCPDDISDSRMLYGLRQIGPGQAAPED